jgi:hypothetical protein
MITHVGKIEYNPEDGKYFTRGEGYVYPILKKHQNFCVGRIGVSIKYRKVDEDLTLKAEVIEFHVDSIKNFEEFYDNN